MYAVFTVQFILMSHHMVSGQLNQSTTAYCILLLGKGTSSSSSNEEYIMFSPSELKGISISYNSSEKLSLRYGFHRTWECENYEKAYLCIQKCVDHGFDVAYSDKHCFCTCYVKKDKAQYTPENTVTRTKWKLGTPTTTMPPWIQKIAAEMKEEEEKRILHDSISNATNITDVDVDGNATDNNQTVIDDVDGLNVTEDGNTTDVDATTVTIKSDDQNGTDVTVNDAVDANGTNVEDGNKDTDASNGTDTNVSNGTDTNASNGTDTEGNKTVTDATNSTDG